jgi:DNA-binding NarL/FixJ family response regulator
MKKVDDANRQLVVLLVSRRRLFAEAVARSLATAMRFRILGVRQTLASLHAEEGLPDVVLTFDGLADGSATEVIRTARSVWPSASIVAALDSDRLEEILRLLQAGADGFVTRSSSLDDLFVILDRAYRHETLVPVTVVQEIERRLDTAKGESLNPARVERLTRREMDVLRSLTEGLRPRAIAERDRTSWATVRTHIQNILRKLGAHSILEAVTFSVRHGIVDAPSTDTSFDHDERARPRDLTRAS